MSTKLLEAVESLIIMIEVISKSPDLPDKAKQHLVNAASELCHVSIALFTKG